MDTILTALEFSINYAIENLLVPGKVENWWSITDLGYTPGPKMPLMWCRSFAKMAQIRFKCRNLATF